MNKKKEKKILLISPPRSKSRERMPVIPPLGLMSIASMLEDCEIVNCLLHKDIERLIRKKSPDVVGITIPLSLMAKDALNIAKIVKEIDRNILIVIGGIHATLFPEEIAESKYVDHIITGEGEYSFLDLLKNGGGRIIRSKMIENLDSLPMPAYHLVDLSEYWAKKQPVGDTMNRKWVPYMSTRGCPYACTFCSAERIWGRRFRTKSAEMVLVELDKFAKMGIEEIHFLDDNFLLDKNRAKEIFKGMKDYKFVWCAPNGMAINTLDEEIVILMKESGCFAVNIGIESGNQYVLDNIVKKPLNLNRVRSIVKLLKKHKIHAKGLFMLGFPDETKEQLEDTANFIRELKMDWVALNIVTPLPGTHLYDFAKKKGYLRKDYSFDKLTFGKVHLKYRDYDSRHILKLLRELNIENFNLKGKNHNFVKYDCQRTLGLYPKHKLARQCLKSITNAKP